MPPRKAFGVAAAMVAGALAAACNGITGVSGLTITGAGATSGTGAGTGTGTGTGGSGGAPTTTTSATASQTGGSTGSTASTTTSVTSATDACAGVTCSGHGTCSVVAGAASCACSAGYHPNGLACDADQTCAGVTCTGCATCKVTGGIAACECPPGYAPQGNGCVLSPDPCATANCGPGTACVPEAHCQPLGACVQTCDCSNCGNCGPDNSDGRWNDMQEYCGAAPNQSPATTACNVPCSGGAGCIPYNPPICWPMEGCFSL